MLDTAAIEIDRHPVLRGSGREWQIASFRWVRKSGKKYHDESTNVSIVSVSRRAGPPQRRTGARSRTSDTWASGESPRPVNCIDLRKFNRQLVCTGTGTIAVLVAEDHRDRRAPIALARNAPVLQPDTGLRPFADAPRAWHRGNHLLLRFRRRQAGELSRVHLLYRKRRLSRPSSMRPAQRRMRPRSTRVVAVRTITIRPRRTITTWDRQVVFACEFEVALVMRGHGHDGTRAVLRRARSWPPRWAPALPCERIHGARSSRIEAFLVDRAGQASLAIERSGIVCAFARRKAAGSGDSGPQSARNDRDARVPAARRLRRRWCRCAW